MSTRREVKKHLFDILEAARDIGEYTSGLEYSDFIGNGMVQAAVERKFQIIGEALNRIKWLDDSVLHSISEHQRIIAFRNIIVHGYDVIDSEIIWDAIENHLPKLRAEVERLLNA
jgi:uncharacterized protein with HEPN domain